jgi:hypothetical protein
MPAATCNNTVNVTAGWGANGKDISTEVVKALIQYERRNGPYRSTCNDGRRNDRCS